MCDAEIGDAEYAWDTRDAGDAGDTGDAGDAGDAGGLALISEEEI